jgi:hypothetical protein
MRKDEPAEQDPGVLIKDDRADGAARNRHHGVSDEAARRMMIGTAADYQPRDRALTLKREISAEWRYADRCALVPM